MVRRRSRCAPLALVLAFGLGATACAHGAGPGVAVQKVQSNIEFGLSTTTTTTPVGVAIPPTLSAVNLTGPAEALPAFSYQTTTTFNYGSPSYGTQTNDCPQPPYGASPAKGVTTSVARPPKPGSYKWQVMASQPVSGTKVTLTTTHYVTYYVKNVSKVSTTPNPQGGQTETFTFDVVTPGQQGGTVTTTYEVKENAVQVSESAGNFGQAQYTGAPDRGVSLAAVVDRNSAGTVTASFRPSPAVLLLPLDVHVPQSFQSGGVDPTTGASFSNNATVSGSVKRVNACGQLVDGWDVAGTQTFSGTGGERTTGSVEYAVATQYGGLVTYSAVTPTGSNETETDVIGQLDPDPLPPSQ